MCFPEVSQKNCFQSTKLKHLPRSDHMQVCCVHSIRFCNYYRLNQNLSQNNNKKPHKVSHVILSNVM